MLLKNFAENEKINSLYVQYNASVTDTTVLSDLHEMKLLFGSECIEMRVAISEKSARFVKFQVHPLSFFQTNTVGCGLLYQRVADDLATISCSRGDEEITVIDVCCGVGTIGQFIATSRSVGKVIGVDIVEEAIANARNNAQGNNLKICEYFAGRAETVLPRIIEENNLGENGKIFAVVDPPRVGLHKSVINAIRKNESITTVVYVSCNPASLALDLVKFCEPLTSCPEEEGIAVNKRFEPVSAVAVDMFPNTPHCEVVILLSR
jgi:tRNA (uracil-5-)-methyltransferase